MLKVISEQWPTLLGSLCVAITVGIAVYQLREEYTWRKKEKTLSFATYNNERLRGVFRRIERYFEDIYTTKKPIPIARINAAIEQSKKEGDETDLANDINYLLSRFENLGLCIERGVADYETAWLMLGGPTRQIIMAFAEYIDQGRKAENRIFLWEHALWLAVKIKRSQDRSRSLGQRQQRANITAANLKEASEPRVD